MLPLPTIVAVPPTTVSVPLVTAKVTVMLPAAASRSAIDSPVMALVVSSLVLCAPGTVFTGASLIAVTVTLTVAVSVTPAGLVTV